jgi:hypothetical protein
VVLLVACVSVGRAYVILDTDKCDNSREAVAGCALHFLDLNHDGNITRDEAILGLSNMIGIPCCNVTADYFFRCDFNNDTVLNEIDWNWPPLLPEDNPMNVTGKCLPTMTTLVMACDVCIRNGYDMSTLPAKKGQKKKVQRIRGEPDRTVYQMHSTDPSKRHIPPSPSQK